MSQFRTFSLFSVQSFNLCCCPRVKFSVCSQGNEKPSFGLSLVIPKNVTTLETSVKVDNTIEFFKSYGFTETQILRLVRAYPLILKSDASKTILPKLEFLESKGLSVPEIAKMLSPFPTILGSSLANQITPSYDFLWSLFQSDEKTVAAVKRCPDILGPNFKNVVSNAEILRLHGVPDSSIAYLIQRQPRALVLSPDRIRSLVERVSKMGFGISTTKFVNALFVCASLSKSTWQSKVDTYKSCGFSEEEVSKSFRRDPHFMAHSEEKILAVMDFFVDDMNWSPSLIATYPAVLVLSLKKRIIPRCLVFKVLISKGLVKNESRANLRTLLLASEEIFLEKYVERYKMEASELLKLYKEKLGSED